MSLFKQPTFYITNDVERALFPGWERESNYHIITYRNPYSEWLKNSQKSQNHKITKSQRNLLLVDGKKGSTEGLMKRKEVLTFIKSTKPKVVKPNIVVFKPIVEIEEYCKKMGWRLLNPSPKFAEQFEEKIAQTKLFENLKLRTPKTIVGEVGVLTIRRGVINRTPTGETIRLPAILQFNLGHTGEGTYLISRKSDLETFRRIFSKRPVRISEYIHGIPLTVNAVAGKKVYVSSPSLQITGIPQLTPLPFATVGNDWTYASSKFKVQSSKLRQMVVRIGNELKKKGYRGAFGVDFVIGRNGKPYVIETNIRQVNSCVYESELQAQSLKLKAQSDGIPSGLFDKKLQATCLASTSDGESRRASYKLQETTMSLHFKCLLGQDTGKETLPETLEGAQVFVRAQRDMKWRNSITPSNSRKYFYFSKLTKGDFVKKNAEVLRIQSRRGMVEGRMKLKKDVLVSVKDLIG